MADKRSKKCVACKRTKALTKFRSLGKGYYTESCLLCLEKEGKVTPGSGSAPSKMKGEKEELKRQEIKKELARRELARRRLVHFIKRFEPGYKVGWVHNLVCEELEKFYADVQAGKSPRLMLFIPPRHGKSTIASDYFPSWALGHDPNLEIISSSYSASLPIKFSRRNRSRLDSKEYNLLFSGTGVDPKNQNVEHWQTNAGGGYIAAGVGGSLTGHGAHIFIIDDPVKDAEEADSETMSAATWDWWSAVASTRVAPGGGVLVIQTRWADNDLSGRMIAQMYEQLEEDIPEDEIEKWRIISFPAIAEEDEYQLDTGEFITGDDITAEQRETATLLRHEGEALHEERWPLTYLKRKRRTMVPRHWNALYQQNPVPDDGETFKKSDMIYAPITVNREDIILAALDLAISQKKRTAFTVLSVGALDYKGNLKVLDIRRGRWGTYEIVDQIMALGLKYGRQLNRVGLESGQIKEAVMPVLMREMQRRGVTITIDHDLDPVTDKEVRARPLQGMTQGHRVVFPQNEPWVEPRVRDLLRFPAGRYKDTVDSLSWLARMALATAPPRPPGPRGGGHRSWKDRLRQMQHGTLKDPMAA